MANCSIDSADGSICLADNSQDTAQDKQNDKASKFKNLEGTWAFSATYPDTEFPVVFSVTFPFGGTRCNVVGISYGAMSCSFIYQAGPQHLHLTITNNRTGADAVYDGRVSTMMNNALAGTGQNSEGVGFTWVVTKI